MALRGVGINMKLGVWDFDSHGGYETMNKVRIIIQFSIQRQRKVSEHSLQFMPLLPTSNLRKLRLGNASHKPLQSPKNLRHPLRIQSLPFWLPNQRFNPRQATPNQMFPQPLL